MAPQHKKGVCRDRAVEQKLRQVPALTVLGKGLSQKGMTAEKMAFVITPERISRRAADPFDKEGITLAPCLDKGRLFLLEDQVIADPDPGHIVSDPEKDSVVQRIAG